ncbi:phage tail protein [Thalassospira sp. MIT1370]|uniref:phage tail protein n=1 Tax=unclassified Thalassospira TaxID=2648997 RepID=UPI00399986B7
MQGNSPVECEILNVIQGAGIWPDCDDKTQLLQAINTLISGGGNGGGNTVIIGSEIGTVSAFAMPTAPEGWLVCDGSAISRTDYADLFATIGTVWGAGDEISTFNLPDLRGEFVRGFDDGRGVDAGRVFGSSQADAFKEHDHTAIGASRNAGAPYTTAGEEGIWPNGNVDPDRYKTSLNGEAETRPRNVAMTYVIKAFYPTAATSQ